MAPKPDADKPVPGDQQPDPVDAAAAALAAQQQQGEEEPDVDERDVADARRTAEAEEAEAEGKGDPTQADPGAAAAQPQPNQPAGQGGQQQPSDPILIPKARLDEALTQRDKFAQGEAYWRGVAEARAQQQPAQPGQPQPQQAAPTPEQHLAAIQTQQDVLAKKFDDGEITFADLTRQKRLLDNQEQGIREEILLGKVKPAAQPQPAANQGNDELYLNSLTAQLEEQHPWVKVFDQVGTDIDWKYLRDRAVDSLIARGVDPTQGNLGRYELRKEVAVLADQIGPFLVGEKAKAKGIAIPGPKQEDAQRPAGQASLTPMQQARREKLGLAERAPPNLNAMSGSQGDPAGLPSDSQIEAMSEDQFDTMPDAQRRRLLGMT